MQKLSLTPEEPRIFETPPIREDEELVIEQIRNLRKSLQHAVAEPRRWSGVLRRVAMARAIQGSNTIEGYNVTLEDALAVVEGEEPFEAEGNTWAAVRCYRDALTYILQLYDDPFFEYSEGLIRSLHFMIMQYDLSKSPGRWRGGPAHVFDTGEREVVYDAPPAESVPDLMQVFIKRLNEDPPETSALVRGAMAHLNMVTIHPFRDGNGRMGRAIQTLVLAREGILSPQFSSIEEYLGSPRNTPEYYRVLGQVARGGWHPENDARPWIHFILTAHYRQAKTTLHRIQLAERLWATLERVASQRGVQERSVAPLFNAALGFRLRNSTYRSVADVSPSMASRDLRTLVEAGLLVPHGRKKGRFYMRSPELAAIHEQAKGPKPEMEDPFEEARQLKLHIG